MSTSEWIISTTTYLCKERQAQDVGHGWTGRAQLQLQSQKEKAEALWRAWR